MEPDELEIISGLASAYQEIHDRQMASEGIIKNSVLIPAKWIPWICSTWILSCVIFGIVIVICFYAGY